MTDCLATILHGNALALDIADSTVDLVVTSPPYFSLRSYQDGGEHYAGQIGAEATPTEFVDALIAATREMMRVLKPSGSIWVNLGDKYSSGGRTTYDVTDINGSRGGNRVKDGFPPKTLLGIPWRYALRCIDELGLILRAEVVWSKPNGLPESVTDRVRRSHEQWFHFTKEPRYYSAVDEIREPFQDLSDHALNRHNRRGGEGYRKGVPGQTPHGMTSSNNPLGKLPGSVWTIASQPLTVPTELGISHFASFPMEWPRRIIRGWSPAGVCVACGEGRRPVSDGSRCASRPVKDTPSRFRSPLGQQNGDKEPKAWTITGYACACPEPTADTTPGVILDPFGGTGTTALVAKALGRHGISVDLSADYSRLAEWRTNDPGQLAQAMEVEKPPVEIAGQFDLFGEIA